MSTALTGMVFNARRGRLKKTNQITAYHSGDDGDYEKGLLQQYDVLTVGTYSGTKNIEVAHYANNGISFVAPNQINDAAAGLATVLTGDTIVVKGSVGNDGVYTVAGGGVAAGFTTVEAIANGIAGPYVSLYKRTAHSNECVRDLRTGLMWSRNTSNAEKVGEASNGTLIWADVTKVYTLHPAAADVAMVLPGNIVRIVGGAAEVTRYHVGDLIDCAGFAVPANNLVGYYVVSVTVNGADLDIVIDPLNSVLVNAAAGPAVSIGLVTRSIYNYVAGARTIGIANYTDWRNPNDEELDSLRDMEAPTAAPNAASFPGWPTATYFWSSTTVPSITNCAETLRYSDGRRPADAAKTTAYLAALVRPNSRTLGSGLGPTLLNPYEPKVNQYKGQLHCHTTNSDGADTPTVLETAYRNAGYDFVCVTDHNFLTPDPVVGGILHIDGVEESATEGDIISVDPTVNQPLGAAQTVINAMLVDGAIPIMAHPNWPGATWTDAELQAISGYDGIEIFNSVVAPNSNAEDKWDTLLSTGREAVGTAVDDCHWTGGANFDQAWVVVFADTLTTAELKDGLVKGNFYSSTGPSLTISVLGDTITATTGNLSTIDWIGVAGGILRSTPNVIQDSYTAVGGEIYARARVTRNADGKNAWSNPIYVST